jgi:hypothetical protein
VSRYAKEPHGELSRHGRAWAYTDRETGVVMAARNVRRKVKDEQGAAEWITETEFIPLARCDWKEAAAMRLDVEQVKSGFGLGAKPGPAIGSGAKP